MVKGSGGTKVKAGHHVGVEVVVDHGCVLVRAGDAVDVEEPVLAEEAQRDPHPGGLDQQLGTHAVAEGVIPAGPHVAVGGERDGRRDVELRGAGCVVGTCFEAVDGSPREKCAVNAEFLGADPCIRQHVMPELKDLAGTLRVGVGQVRQEVDLLVPEVVPFVAGAADALGRDAGDVCACRGLRQLEQVPADGLLQFRLPAHHDVRGGPVIAVMLLAFGEDVRHRAESLFGGFRGVAV